MKKITKLGILVGSLPSIALSAISSKGVDVQFLNNTDTPFTMEISDDTNCSDMSSIKILNGKDDYKFHIEDLVGSCSNA